MNNSKEIGHEENEQDIKISEQDVDMNANEERPGVGYEIFGVDQT